MSVVKIFIEEIIFKKYKFLKCSKYFLSFNYMLALIKHI